METGHPHRLHSILYKHKSHTCTMSTYGCACRYERIRGICVCLSSHVDTVGMSPLSRGALPAQWVPLSAPSTAVPQINIAEVTHLHTLGVCNHSLHCVLLHLLHQPGCCLSYYSPNCHAYGNLSSACTPCTKLMGNGTGGLMQPSSFGWPYVPTWTHQCSTMPTSIIPRQFFCSLFFYEAFLAFALCAVWHGSRLRLMSYLGALSAMAF